MEADLHALKKQLEEAGIDASSIEFLPQDESIATLVVPGGDAVATWNKLRGIRDLTGRWPIICGEATEALSSFADRFELIPSLEDVLESVPSGSTHQVIAEFRGDAHEAMHKVFQEMKDSGEDVPDFLLNSAEVDELTLELNRAHESEPWPAPPNDSIRQVHSTSDVLTRKPFERCLIALLPTLNPAEAPAYLRFGGYNSCPPPEVHVAIMQDWGSRYGAIPMCITSDVIECLVADPPQTPEEARLVAREQENYCDDIVSQGVESVERLARTIWRSTLWYFWWD